MSAIQQIRPEELKNILLPDFQDRNEPNFAWKSAASLLCGLPAIRGVWTMGQVYHTAADQARDATGNDNHLTNNNVVEFAYDRLAPYADFGGTNEYLSRADAGAANWADILGTEAYILAAQRGLTLGGWFNHGSLAATQSLISKFGAGADRSYELLYNLATTSHRFIINNVAVSIASSIVPVVDTWYSVIGRFVPGATGDIYVNGTKDSVATAVAAITDSTAEFAVGARSAGSLYLDGRASMCFLCAAALSDALIGAIYQQQRRMFEAA